MITERIDGPRLKKARLSAGFRSQKALGDRVGLSQQAIGDLETGKTMETTKLRDLAKLCGVSPEYLLGRGEEAPLKNRPNIRALDGHGQRQALPEIDLRGGAAYGGGMIDEEYNEEGVSAHQPVAQWGLPSSFVERELGLTYGMADIIQVRGDSMDDGTSKGLASGDRVIIDRQDTDPRQGGIFAIFDGDGVIIKQVELVRGKANNRVICKSRNPSYDPIDLILDERTRIIGRVAGKFQRL